MLDAAGVINEASPYEFLSTIASYRVRLHHVFE